MDLLPDARTTKPSFVGFPIRQGDTGLSESHLKVRQNLSNLAAQLILLVGLACSAAQSPAVSKYFKHVHLMDYLLCKPSNCSGAMQRTPAKFPAPARGPAPAQQPAHARDLRAAPQPARIPNLKHAERPPHLQQGPAPRAPFMETLALCTGPRPWHTETRDTNTEVLQCRVRRSGRAAACFGP